MALTVEDGSGLPGADSLVSLAGCRSFMLGRDDSFEDFVVASVSEQERYLREATAYLSGKNFRGSRATATQSLPWPRVGASYRNGPVFAKDFIPQAVKDAVCLLAGHAAREAKQGLSILNPSARGGMVKREKIGDIEQEYFEGAPSQTVYSDVEVLLYGLLRSSDDFSDVSIGVSLLAPDVPVIPENI